MRTIMVLNAKGGSGKSTIATNLASYFASEGKSVVLADYDPQESSLDWLKARPKGRPPIKGVAAHKETYRPARNTDYVILDEEGTDVYCACFTFTNRYKSSNELYSGTKEHGSYFKKRSQNRSGCE